MRLFVQFIAVLLFPLGLWADTLSGVVVGPDGRPVTGASVSVDQRSTETNASGRFGFELPAGQYTVRVRRDGFQPRDVNASTGAELSIALKPALEESIVVSGIRAEQQTPVTKS